MQERPGPKQQEAAVPRDPAHLKDRYKSIGIDALKGATMVRPKKAEQPRRPLDRDTD